MLTAMSEMVTTGVVREGMTSRSGIMQGYGLSLRLQQYVQS